MKRLEEAKKQFENIEIPGELNDMVLSSIKEYEAGVKGEKTIVTLKNIGKYMSIAAACVILCFTLLLNTSASFAKEMENVPVIGGIARVLTVRSYQEEENGIRIEAQIPEVTLTQEETVKEPVKNKIIDVNEAIQKVSDQYMKEAKQRAEEYKQAFMETGGTEEEWEEHDIEIKVDYKICYQDDTTLSFLFTGSENWSSAYAVSEYYNIDLSTGKEITLQDRFGEGYEKWVNKQVISQMEEEMKQDSSAQYWISSPDWEGEKSDIEGFVTVSDQTKFYLNSQGNVVIVFDKYEVAPGAMGSPEFEIIASED